MIGKKIVSLMAAAVIVWVFATGIAGGEDFKKQTGGKGLVTWNNTEGWCGRLVVTCSNPEPFAEVPEKIGMYLFNPDAPTTKGSKIRNIKIYLVIEDKEGEEFQILYCFGNYREFTNWTYTSIPFAKNKPDYFQKVAGEGNGKMDAPVKVIKFIVYDREEGAGKLEIDNITINDKLAAGFEEDIWPEEKAVGYCKWAFQQIGADGSPIEKQEVAMKSSGDDQIEVKVGKSFLISKSTDFHWFPTLKQVSSKQLFVNIWCTKDVILPSDKCCTAYCWTSNGGKTWEPVVTQGDAGHSWIRMKDGTCLWLSYHIMYRTERECTINVGRSTDGKHYKWTEGTVNFAPHKISKQDHGTGSIVVSRSILEMPDGSLLASMYGRFVGDKVYRSILMRSADKGETWQYFSTMGFEPKLWGEGLDEPCVVELVNGDLFCIMRNDVCKPMYSVRSSDGGKTWTKPARLPSYAASVFPDLTLMSNGILACSFGRWGCKIMFSVDGKGEQWTKPTTILEVPKTDVWKGPTTGYTGIREVAPGRLLYVYDIVPAGWFKLQPGKFNEIRGVFISVGKN